MKMFVMVLVCIFVSVIPTFFGFITTPDILQSHYGETAACLMQDVVLYNVLANAKGLSAFGGSPNNTSAT